MANALSQSLFAAALLVAPVMGATVLDHVAPEQSWLKAGTAHAQLMRPADTKPEPRRIPGMSQQLIKKLTEVNEVIEPDPEEQPGVEPDPRRGLQMMEEIAEDMDEYNPYEQAQIHQYLARLYYDLDRVDDAIESFEFIVAQSPQIPSGLETSIWLFLGKIHMQQENYQKSYEAFQQWTQMVTRINDDQYYDLSLLFYNMDDEDRALTHVNEAVRIAEEKGDVPNENWLQMQRLLYYNKENYTALVEVLEKLVRHYPKISYWRQMSDVYSLLERYDDRLYSLEVVYMMDGIDDERVLVSLASMFLDKEVPYKAAKILDKGIYEDETIEPTADNLEMLANSWSLAQESDKALVEIEKAAEKSDEGDLFARLASIYIMNERYRESVEASREALDKGVDRSDEVYLRMGTALANLGEYDEALDALKEAAKDKRSKDVARQWMSYVEKEKKREERKKAEEEAAAEEESEAPALPTMGAG